MSFEARLDEIENRLHDLEAEWSRPGVAADLEVAKRLGREQAVLAPIVENYRLLRDVRAQLEARSASARRAGRGDARVGAPDRR